jgi:hypothetical protein
MATAMRGKEKLSEGTDEQRDAKAQISKEAQRHSEEAL